MRRRRPRNPMRCPWCFRTVGATRHNVIVYHKFDEGPGSNPRMRKCPGTGCYGGDVR